MHKTLKQNRYDLASLMFLALGLALIVGSLLSGRGMKPQPPDLAETFSLR